MRRATNHGSISPTLLKHFGAVAVVLTGLLALFASGDDWGAQAQVEAVEAKNQLATAEAEKLGARKLASKLKVSQDVASGSVGFDEGGAVSFSGGGDYRPARLTRPLTQGPARPPLLVQQPGPVVSRDPAASEASPPGDPRKKDAPPEAYQPSTEQIEQAKAASLNQSSSAASAD